MSRHLLPVRVKGLNLAFCLGEAYHGLADAFQEFVLDSKLHKHLLVVVQHGHGEPPCLFGHIAGHTCLV